MASRLRCTWPLATAAVLIGVLPRVGKAFIAYGLPPYTMVRPTRISGMATKVEVTPELIRKTAGLAQLEISNEEVKQLLPRVESFLGFVETMGDVDEDEQAAAEIRGFKDGFLREDEPEVFANVAAVLENMPLEEDSYLRVPRVGEEEG